MENVDMKYSHLYQKKAYCIACWWCCVWCVFSFMAKRSVAAARQGYREYLSDSRKCTIWVGGIQLISLLRGFIVEFVSWMTYLRLTFTVRCSPNQWQKNTSLLSIACRHTFGVPLYIPHYHVSCHKRPVSNNAKILTLDKCSIACTHVA